MKTIEAQCNLIRNETIKQSMICTININGYVNKVDVLNMTKVVKNIK